ncbi:MAG TPA: amidohydrolase [Thermoflexia bacterium]|nr:amidohydrolase [Thermoflexia bacterium]
MNGLEQAQELYEQLVVWRRDFHRHPELGLQEKRTARIVAARLRELGYQVQTGIARTGVVGVLENGAGPVIMARVDMDALPIQELTEAPYASASPGVMHACGHDAHLAIGLGVATLMVQHQDAWSGTFKLVFQPGEEGMNGAAIMVREGVLENPRPERVLVLHVWNDQPVGTVSATPGPVMSSAETWEAQILGKGGHAAMPEQTVDPVVTGALIVNALQTIVSRNVGPLETAVVTVGKLESGDTFNVIPERAVLKGTVRTYEPEVREIVIRRLQEIIEGMAAMMGATAEFKMHALTPAVCNDEAVTAEVQAAIQELLGADGLKIGVRTMGSEDASFYLREIPGCYFFVGSMPVDGKPIPHHNPYFDIDEQVLPIGVGVMVTALQRLFAEGRA